MDVAILHKTGWAITNEAELSAYAVKEGEGYRKVRQVKGVGIFNYEGELKHGDKVEVAVSDNKRAFSGVVTGISLDYFCIDVNNEIDYKETVTKIKRRKK